MLTASSSKTVGHDFQHSCLKIQNISLVALIFAHSVEQMNTFFAF